LADYPYRLSLDHNQFKLWISEKASAVNYRNFKSEVALVRGDSFTKPLVKVWSVMHEAEESLAREIGKENQ